MRKYLEAMDKLDSWARQDARVPEVERIIREGDAKGLRKLKAGKRDDGWWVTALVAELPPIADYEALDGLVLGIIAKVQGHWYLDGYLADNLAGEAVDGNLFDRVVKHLSAAKVSSETIRRMAATAPKTLASGGLNSVGRWVLAQRDLDRWFPGLAHQFSDLEALIVHLAATDQRRLAKLAPAFAVDSGAIWRSTWEPTEHPAGWLVRYGGEALLPVLDTALGKLDDRSAVQLGLALAEVDAERWRDRVLPVARRYGRELRGEWVESARSLMVELARVYGDAAVPLLDELFNVPSHTPRADDTEREFHCLGWCLNVLDEAAGLDLCRRLTHRSDPWISLIGTWGLSELEQPEARAEARALLVEALRRHADRDDGAGGEDHAVSALTVAGDLGGDELVPLVSQLLEASSEAVRTAAARSYGRIGGEQVLERAHGLLTKKAATKRRAGVRALIASASDAALKILDEQLANESDASLRSEIFAALDGWWRENGRQFSTVELQLWIELAGASLRKPPAKWWDGADLPPLCLASGEPLEESTLRWLCHRQAQSSDASLDAEAAVLVERLDPSAAADWAHALYGLWSMTTMDAREKWVLGLVGALGDDRLVQPLTQQATKWSEKARGKMAEYAVQALAAIGSDEALMMVDDLAARFSSKQRNVGAAATEAFAAAAARRGISVDELGDLVVPWLGFESGGARTVDCSGRPIELSVGLDCKLRYLDPARGKSLKSLPKAEKTVKDEVKQLGATLRAAMKTQRQRHERMLVTQRRWPRDRWLELYPLHPVLAPFAVTLVWGGYDADGELRGTFRMLEDRTFTDADDDEVALDCHGMIGIVHPLELGPAAIEAWWEHLADHEVAPPFAQLERPIYPLPAAERDTRQLDLVNGTELSAGTFRGRIERRGWSRGSVVDAGGVTSYYRSFPAASVDVFLLLDDLYMGIEPTEQITLRQAYFVRGGSVQVGSYTYEEPGQVSDERVLAFGDVPPIVYSEALTDLKMISGADPDEEP